LLYEDEEILNIVHCKSLFSRIDKKIHFDIMFFIQQFRGEEEWAEKYAQEILQGNSSLGLQYDI